MRLKDRIVLATGKGIATVTLCANEKTLRAYWRNHDNKGTTIIDAKKTDNLPSGSSGIQLRIQVGELLAGFARHRIFRGDRQT